MDLNFFELEKLAFLFWFSFSSKTNDFCDGNRKSIITFCFEWGDYNTDCYRCFGRKKQKDLQKKIIKIFL